MRQVQNFIREQKMIMPGDFVIAGVSGGADSVCLFFELLAYQKEIPFSMEVVHIEHGIRGQDSLADANYVENLCKEYGVPFHLVSCDIKKMAQESSLTVEEAGRKARYQAFEQAAKKSGRSNCKIAVAHNLDDQAETILMNLARGSGLRGLGGIRPVRENIIRPLLNTRRSEIEAARQRAISHRQGCGFRRQRIISRARCRNLQSVTYIMRKKRSQKYFLSGKDSAVRSI